MCTNSITRLEKGLLIALKRAHGGDLRYAAFLIDNLETDQEAPEYAPGPYQAWQDVKRLVGELELLEQAAGIQHVKVVGHV